MMTPQQHAFERLYQQIAATLNQMEQLLALGASPIPLCRPRRAAVGDEQVSCRAGWHPVPCPDAGKRVLVKGFPMFATNPVPPSEARTMFSMAENPNIGVVVADGYVALDADSPDAELEVLEHIGDVRTVLREARPGRGPVWLFRLPAGFRCAWRTHAGRSGKIDILPAGRYFVTPPSVHRTGHQFHWAPGQAPGEIEVAELPPSALALLAEAEPSKAKAILGHATEAALSGDVSAKVRALLRTRSDLRRLWNGEGKHHGDTSASGVDFAVALYLLRERIRPEDVLAALAHRPGGHKSDVNYLVRTVNAAHRRPGAK